MQANRDSIMKAKTGRCKTLTVPDQLYRADYAGARYYLDLFGASHLIPYEGTNPVERLLARVTLAFFDRYVLGHADALETMTRAGNVTGTAALVSGGQPPP
jgi:hypothetical protein